VTEFRPAVAKTLPPSPSYGAPRECGIFGGEVLTTDAACGTDSEGIFLTSRREDAMARQAGLGMDWDEDWMGREFFTAKYSKYANERRGEIFSVSLISQWMTGFRRLVSAGSRDSGRDSF
jgi:hypothetical protein